MTKRKLLQIAKRLGVRLEFANNEVEAIAPFGMTFRSDPSLHYMVSSDWGGEYRMPEVYDDMANRLSGGIEPCPLPDCEYCEANLSRQD